MLFKNQANIEEGGTEETFLTMEPISIFTETRQKATDWAEKADNLITDALRIRDKASEIMKKHLSTAERLDAMQSSQDDLFRAVRRGDLRMDVDVNSHGADGDVGDGDGDVGES